MAATTDSKILLRRTRRKKQKQRSTLSCCCSICSKKLKFAKRTENPLSCWLAVQRTPSLCRLTGYILCLQQQSNWQIVIDEEDMDL